MKITASTLGMSVSPIIAKNFVKVKLLKSSTCNIRKKVEGSKAEQILTWDSRDILEW